MKLLISFIALLLLVGCITTSRQVHKNTKARMINSGKSIDYAEGYADGDSIGRKSNRSIGNPHTFIKDTERYRSNDKYKQGWDDGFMGRGNYEAYMRMKGH